MKFNENQVDTSKRSFSCARRKGSSQTTCMVSGDVHGSSNHYTPSISQPEYKYIPHLDKQLGGSTLLSHKRKRSSDPSSWCDDQQDTRPSVKRRRFSVDRNMVLHTLRSRFGDRAALNCVNIADGPDTATGDELPVDTCDDVVDDVVAFTDIKPGCGSVIDILRQRFGDGAAARCVGIIHKQNQRITMATTHDKHPETSHIRSVIPEAQHSIFPPKHDDKSANGSSACADLPDDLSQILAVQEYGK